MQAYDLRAPPILIRPSVSVFGGYTDNPRDTPSKLSDVYTRLGGNTAISVDTVRLQGQLSGGISYQKFARATDQDTLNANLLAYGLGTVVRDHIFIDGRAAIMIDYRLLKRAKAESHLLEGRDDCVSFDIDGGMRGRVQPPVPSRTIQMETEVPGAPRNRSTASESGMLSVLSSPMRTMRSIR